MEKKELMDRREPIETGSGFAESNGKDACIKVVIDDRNYPELLLVCVLGGDGVGSAPCRDSITVPYRLVVRVRQNPF